MSFVKVDHLWVRYGKTVAVRDLTFDIPKGEVFGFIGPNGTGKTTTIKVLATLLRPVQGRVSINGLDVLRHPQAVRRRIGYMPDFFGVYEDLTVNECLHFFAGGLPTRPGGAKNLSGLQASLDGEALCWSIGQERFFDFGRQEATSARNNPGWKLSVWEAGS